MTNYSLKCQPLRLVTRKLTLRERLVMRAFDAWHWLGWRLRVLVGARHR